MKSSVGVIGAGIQGVCISLFLIKKGFKVTLIDRDDPGKESASYGNAGHFSPYASVPINRPDSVTKNIESSTCIDSRARIRLILNTDRKKLLNTLWGILPNINATIKR